MAETNPAALTALQVKLYSAKVWKQTRESSFFFGDNGFMSDGRMDSTKPIHYVDEFTRTKKGDKAILPLVQDLQGDGMPGDQRVKGNEEAMQFDSLEMVIDQLRHGASDAGRMNAQRTVIEFRANAKDVLGFWWSDKLDELGFLTVGGIAYTKTLMGATRGPESRLSELAFAASVAAPSTNRKLFAGSATSTATLTASDKMTWDLVVKAKAMAGRKRLKPLRVRGENTYVLVMSTEQARDLRQSSDYKTLTAQAQERGDKNPLFQGAFRKIEGLWLYECNKVPNTLNAASGSKYGASGTVDGAQALLLGAQALGFARLGDPTYEEETDDYKNLLGFAYGQIIGFLKPKWKSPVDNMASEDFSVISIHTAAAA